MNAITDVWRQLVRRRLWPVALLLVAALVAVPMTLAKSPAPPPPAPPVAAAPKGDDPTTAFVSVAKPEEAKRRRVLGMPKDPFAPAPLPKTKKRAKVSRAANATPTPTAEAAGPSGGSTAPPSSAPPSTTPTAPAVPTVTLPKGTVKIRFGDTSSETDELPKLFVNRLEPIPNATSPVLVFEGLRDHGRSAVFSIPGDVTGVGDGACDPRPDDCAELKLRAGETEFITIKGGGANGADVQYQLDLVKIFSTATKVPKSEVDESASS